MKYCEVKVGDLVELTWWDACGYTNESLSKAKLARAVSTGYVVKKERRCIVLCSSTYNDDDDPTGDYEAIPVGWLENIRRIRKRRK